MNDNLQFTVKTCYLYAVNITIVIIIIIIIVNLYFIEMMTVFLLFDWMYRNSLRGSAVCAFKLDDMVASFEGRHKEQKTAHSNWLPVRQADIPDPHPAKVCVKYMLHSSYQHWYGKVLSRSVRLSFKLLSDTGINCSSYQEI